jgi:5-methylcytosine-specific restriction protein A
MLVSDLPDPVNAMKADWLVASSWIGFTPQGKGGDAAQKCQSAINKQTGSGYVVEYITKNIDKPNAGFENDAEHLEERKLHAANAGRLVAVHRLRPSSRNLREILGNDSYERLQNMWSQNGSRSRWSVAFPIVESYHIEGRPLATDVLTPEAMQRLIKHTSATLRPFSEKDRAAFASLSLTPRLATNAWIAIEDEIKAAEGSSIDPSIVKNIDRDLINAAVEGMTGERWAKVRLRAAWLAGRFVRERAKAGKLNCDHCTFEPAAVERLAGIGINLRSTLDVHHLKPLEEGRRRTTLADFALLCPTCHRIEHLVLRATTQIKAKARL